MSRIICACNTIAFLLLVACGGGDGRDELQPPIVTNPSSLLADRSLPTVETISGGFIQEQRADPNDFGIAGRIKELRGYRTDTEVVFRIEEELGFRWDTDVYMVWITDIRWRGIPAHIVLYNIGDPFTDTTGGADIQLVPSGIVSSEPAIEVRQWRDKSDDGFFYLSIPLDLFNFANELDDANSVFNVQARLDRMLPSRTNFTSRTIRDFTDPAKVDFVDPN